MEAIANDSGLDRYPVHARCDICGHPHACYVGGSPGAGDGSLGWERHVCLGCLMRASAPGGFASCEECAAGVETMTAGPRDA